MRISLSLMAENRIKLPVSYNYHLQSLIYGHIDGKLADFLHDQGYTIGKRRFKLFTFSRIEGKIKFIKEKKVFQVETPFKIVISSPIEHFVQSLAENMVKSESVTLLNQKLFLQSVNVYAIPKIDSEVVAQMLSPVTMLE